MRNDSVIRIASVVRSSLQIQSKPNRRPAILRFIVGNVFRFLLDRQTALHSKAADDTALNSSKRSTVDGRLFVGRSMMRVTDSKGVERNARWRYLYAR
jgi:hypothetical protein